MNKIDELLEETPTMERKKKNPFMPSNAFIGASWVAFFVGFLAYCIGLWNTSKMELNEKGYYFTVLLFGLFAVISVQKTVRDRLENIPVTDIYYGVCWFGTIAAILLLIVGLWNAELTISEKGFYGMAYGLALFGVVAVQKNVRDVRAALIAEDN